MSDTTTTPTPEDRLAAATLRTRAARAEREAIVSERALASTVARFDVVDPNHPNTGTRRRPKIELKNEDDQLLQRRKLEGVNLTRTIFANSSQMRAMHTQFEVNVVGASGPKVKFHITDDDADKAGQAALKKLGKSLARWFNGDYSKNCDVAEDMPLQEMLGIALTTVKREGEVLAVFDDFDANDGCLLWYEIDQLPTIPEKIWHEYALAENYVELTRGGPSTPPRPRIVKGKKIPLRQKNGRVMDRRGKVLFYVVAADKRGREDVTPADCTFIPKSSARMLKKPWRFGQTQGQSEVLTIAADVEDMLELRNAEIASAKKLSKRAYIVKGENAYEDALARAGVRADDQIEDAGTDPESGATFAPVKTAERLENMADGFVDYLSDKDTIEEFGTDRPNMNVQHLYSEVGVGAGAALGLAAVFTTLKASTSYTAFRGEMLLSWLKFKWDQKWLERRFMDWIVPKAIAHGMETGAFDEDLHQLARGADWQTAFSFTWPRMPEVDELKAVNARAKRLKIGDLLFTDLLGPDWEEKLEQLGIEVARIRELKLPLEMLETKAGAPTDGGQNNNDDD